MSGSSFRSLISTNRKARYDYEIYQTYQAGIVLLGSEVKSLRSSSASLVDGYGFIKDGEVWLDGVNIAQYKMANWTNHQPKRTRKLLLRRFEIIKITNKIRESGYTLIPLKMYFLNGKVKVELAEKELYADQNKPDDSKQIK